MFAAVNRTAIDLRKEIGDLPKDYSHCPNRETQLLRGEPLKIIERSGEWLRVSTKMQPHRSGEYEGWVKANEIHQGLFEPTHVVAVASIVLLGQFYGYGSFVRIENDQLRLPGRGNLPLIPGGLRSLSIKPSLELLLKDAKLFLDKPYLWGGCALHSEKEYGSVDCSSLIHLLMRAQGKIIPRNASEQAIELRHTEHISPGVAVYIAKENAPDCITHVLLCVEENTFMHAPGTGKTVCNITLGKEIVEKDGMWRIKGLNERYHIYPRSLFE